MRGRDGWIVPEDEEWLTSDVKVGCVMEFMTLGFDFPETEEAHGALLVTGVEPRDERGLIVHGRLVGSSREVITTQLSLLINRRDFPLHLCGGEPCPAQNAGLMVHVGAVRCYEREGFAASYMKTWGKLVLKEYGETGEVKTRRKKTIPLTFKPKAASKKPSKEEAKAPEKGEDGKGKGGKDKRRRRKPKEKDGKDGKEEKDFPDPGDSAALRKKLQALKNRASGGKAVEEEAGEKDGPETDEKEEVESVDSSTSESSPAVATPKLSTGTQLVKPSGQLAIMDKPSGEPELTERLGRDRRRDSKRHKGEAEAQLLALAAQKSKDQEAEKKLRREEKKRKDRGRKERDSVKESRKKKKKRKKDKKKKKKKRKGGGGGPSSPSSESSRSESEEDDSMESSSSSLLAPLQKKSKQDPGAVLQLLLKHAKQLMDQDAAVDTAASSGVLGGVRMTSYFSLLLRPYYSTASRDMKELFLLATAIDELRQGRLGSLGDSLASRFIAIQTAMSDGSWRSAQFLEMHPLENTSPAPMPLLLQARKHAKVVDRSLRVDDGGRRGNWRGQDNRNQWQNEEKGKGKGGKGKGQGKKGKGKGKNSWGSGYQGGGWNNWNGQGNANQDWWNSKKDGKDGKDTSKKEDQKKD